MSKADTPIRRWHVSLVDDLRAGKDVASEAAIAIENLEDLLFQTETKLSNPDQVAIDAIADRLEAYLIFDEEGVISHLRDGTPNPCGPTNSR